VVMAPPDVVVKAWAEPVAELKDQALSGVELVLKQSNQLLCVPLHLLFVANFSSVSSCLGCSPQNLPYCIMQHSYSSQTVGGLAVNMCKLG
jgi:hypothetical protein